MTKPQTQPKASATAEAAHIVCPNCGQYQYPRDGKGSFYDCLNDCTARGFAPKVTYSGKPAPTVTPPGKNVNADQRQEANARLIAAAPELYAIAKEIADSKCDLGDSERRIRLYSAIQKAGEL